MSSTEQLELDRETIGRIDPTDQLTDVLAIPEHLRDALWKVESAGLEPWDSPDGLVVAGMGGSAIGGHLARAILGDHASRPLLGARAYGLPPWTTPDTTVLCASYSGNTEETLACYEAAGVIGARRVVVTSGGKLAELARADQVPVVPVAGGFQPRAAVAYMTVAALQVAALCGVGPGMNSELDVAADHLEELVIEWGPEGPPDGLAKSLARAMHGTVPVVAGAGLTTPIAYRWKTQVNENAKMPAYALELPEMDHNEIVGWGSAGEFAPLLRRLPRRRRHPSAGQGAHRRHGAPHRAGRRGRAPRRVARPEHGRARLLARAPGRPRVGLPRRAARRGPRARRDPRPPEGRARRGRVGHAGPALLLAAAAGQGPAGPRSAGCCAPRRGWTRRRARTNVLPRSLRSPPQPPPRGARPAARKRPPQRRATPRRAEPTRGEVAAMREAAREAETGGADSVGAQVHVAEPWAGYDAMRLDEVLTRLQGATEVELAVVAAYEREHEARQAILLAAGEPA